MIARCRKSKYAMNMAELESFWCCSAGYSLLSGTILSPPMLARLLIGSPETVLGAIHEVL
jgi:hypothetical protein